MIIQANWISTPIKTQLMRDLGEFCKYHQQFGHDIDHCEKFYDEMERIMILCMLRLKSAKKDVVIRMITCQD